jgi:hypothetical protein
MAEVLGALEDFGELRGRFVFDVFCSGGDVALEVAVAFEGVVAVEGEVVRIDGQACGVFCDVHVQ